MQNCNLIHRNFFHKLKFYTRIRVILLNENCFDIEFLLDKKLWSSWKILRDGKSPVIFYYHKHFNNTKKISLYLILGTLEFQYCQSSCFLFHSTCKNCSTNCKFKETYLFSFEQTSKWIFQLDSYITWSWEPLGWV